MAVVDVVALVIGGGITVVAAVLAKQVASSPDKSMRWEGGVAVGFGALVMVGPFWVAQLVLTVIATKSDGGLGAWWLWALLFAGPWLGVMWGGRAR